MDKKYLLLILLVFLSFDVSALANYSDTVIVVNNYSATSVNITQEFINRRNASGDIHIAYLNLTTAETISFVTYNTSIRLPLQDYLISNGLVDSINYIILTKGVPLRIDNTGGYRCASVDAKTAIMLGDRNFTLSIKGSCATSGESNPMYNKTVLANKSYYGIYIVSRLDGYTTEDIINAMGPTSVYNLTTKTVLLDRRPDKTGGYLTWDRKMTGANKTLTERNLSVFINETNNFLINDYKNLAGYISWGSNDGNATSNSSKWNLSFASGSVAETGVSTSGRSFVLGTSYGQSLIADLIRMNVSFVKGYVYEPYTDSLAAPEILFERYSRGYTTGEAFYMASPTVNGMSVFVGDPKMLGYSNDTVDNPSPPPTDCTDLYDDSSLPFDCYLNNTCEWRGTGCVTDNVYTGSHSYCFTNGTCS